ncbi:hypothetical protein Pcinc_003993 [Petrolisthes cinctipes]|uniref:Uncharacterized protein n=1 Tax=Petrolisthes cinctipes TaxID=88211 RepID=A0AAE1GI07_PETCI|nr:hypothetical protein Pcinc_003993 [Petrolisthes cinctipes]
MPSPPIPSKAYQPHHLDDPVTTYVLIGMHSPIDTGTALSILPSHMDGPLHAQPAYDLVAANGSHRGNVTHNVVHINHMSGQPYFARLRRLPTEHLQEPLKEFSLMQDKG